MICPSCGYKHYTIDTKVYHLIDTPQGTIKEQCPSCGYHIFYTAELFDMFIEIYSIELFHKPYIELTDEEKTPRHFYKVIQFTQVLCGE